MPALANPTLWRTHPYSSDVRLWLFAPPVVAAMRVDQTAFSYPLAELTVDGYTTGAYTDLEVGMTVLIGSSAGADDLGRTYVRKAPTSTVLYIGRSSRGRNDGEVNPNNNMYITVLDDYRIWALVPRIASGAVKYTDEDRDFTTYKKRQPVIVLNCGLAIQADVNPATGKATFSMVASSSYAPEPGATISSYAYTLPAGASVTSGSASTHTVTFTVDQGDYWLRLVVTDSNGTTATRRVKLVAETDSNVEGWTLIPWRFGDEGQRVKLKFEAPISRATYPDGTLLVLWHKERYGATAGSLGGPTGSEHMLFAGWMDTEAANRAASDKGMLTDTTIEFVDAAQRLAQLAFPALPTGRDETPADWGEMAAANIDLLMIRGLQEFTTALSLVDFVWSGTGATYAFSRWDTTAGNVWSVMRGLARALGLKYVLTGDEWGRLAVRIDPQMIDSGSRTATAIVSLLETDWSRVQSTTARPATTKFLYAEATVSTTTEASATRRVNKLNTVAPGLSGGQGTNESTESGFLVPEGVAGQTALNEVNRHLYARRTALNGSYPIALAHGGNAGISPALKEWLPLTISADSAAERGDTKTAVRCLPIEVQVDYDAEYGMMSRVVVVEEETVGIASVGYTVKQPVSYALPGGGSSNWTPPANDFGMVPAVPATLAPSGSGQLGAVTAGGYWVYTLDLSTPPDAGGPTWFMTALALDGALLDGVPLPFSPGALPPAFSGAKNWEVLTTTKIYGLGDVFGTLAATLHHSLPATVHYGMIQTERAEAGWIIAATYREGGGVAAHHSEDGAAYASVTVSSDYDTSTGITLPPALFMSPFTAGLARVVAFTATGAAPAAQGYESANHGGSWAPITNPNLNPNERLGCLLEVPYGDQTVTYMTKATLTGIVYTFELIKVVGVVQTVISPTYLGVSFGPAAPRAIRAFDGDPLRLVTVAIDNNTPGVQTAGVWVSEDGGASWLLILTPDVVAVQPVRRCAWAPDGRGLFVMGTNTLLFTPDYRTVPLQDCSGNLSGVGDLMNIGG